MREFDHPPPRRGPAPGDAPGRSRHEPGPPSPEPGPRRPAPAPGGSESGPEPGPWDPDPGLHRSEPPPPPEPGSPPPRPPITGSRRRKRRRVVDDEGPRRSRGETLLRAWGIVTLVGVVVVAGVLVAAYLMFGSEIRALGDGIRAQVEATVLARDLEARHPFTPPEDGVVPEDRRTAFLAVTQDVWANAEPWIVEAEVEGGALDEALDPRVLATAAVAAEGLARTRLRLMESLAAHEMSVSEYIWTAGALLDAPPEETADDGEDAADPTGPGGG